MKKIFFILFFQLLFITVKADIDVSSIDDDKLRDRLLDFNQKIIDGHLTDLMAFYLPSVRQMDNDLIPTDLSLLVRVRAFNISYRDQVSFLLFSGESGIMVNGLVEVSAGGTVSNFTIFSELWIKSGGNWYYMPTNSMSKLIVELELGEGYFKSKADVNSILKHLKLPFLK